MRLMPFAEGAPVVVDRLSELKAYPGGWVWLRETGQVYVEHNGEWVPYVSPAVPNLWSLLEEDT